ncbi:MAG: L,D-transpeptidase, partial [Actinomycetia bacterium]|nr:L,D-transpeptidase [Actinomycetes bacterium]
YSFALPGAAPYEYGSPQMVPIGGEFGALPGSDDPPPNPPPYPNVGSGKRIIYSNSQQRIWLIDQNNVLVDTYLVTGRKGIPYNGTYRVFSKSVNAWAPYGGITMKHMVRFVRPGTWGNQWSYGFHSIPRYSDGRPMQTEDQLGTFRSGGCVRQADHKATALFAWADIGTVVHAIP